MASSNHSPAQREDSASSAGWRSAVYLAVLVIGYIGVYICRKNFSVAIPLLREAFGATKEQLGEIASLSTLAYMAGKFGFGVVIDRFGGRVCFLASLLLVAIFGGAGGLAPSLGMLAVFYSANRLAGSAGWGAMVKLVPDWFPARWHAFAMAVLSLGFVFGGLCATLLAGWIAGVSGNDWRWVMGGPALVLVGILILCWAVLPRVGGGSEPGGTAATSASGGFQMGQVKELFRVRRFWVVCALSFTLTLLRETFNTWTVDFFKTEGGPEVSHRIAAFLSTPFDACGAVGILLLGWVFGRVSPDTRRNLLMVILGALGLVILGLPTLARQGLVAATVAVGLVGFLTYGPYSLLAGVLSLEIRGRGYVATVAGLVDGAGYLAAIMAGAQFGKLLDIGGYALAFPCLATLALVSAALCLLLYPRGGVTPSST
ncbi:MAG: MFS transporter [Verrucomicrobiales bacterium]|nr:MFS transporter [Verrucomicrobiales bacterium]